MIPMIQMALTYGYTATQILKYVSNKFKTTSPGISQAQQQGYSDEDILKFLGKKIKPKNKNQVDKDLSAQERYMKSVGMKTKGEKDETRNKFISGALGLGATALGAYGMYKNLGGMGQTFGTQGTAPRPQLPGGMPPGPDSSGITIQPTPAAPVNPPPQAPQTPGQMATPQTPTPGPNIGQQIAQQAAQPVAGAMQPTTPQGIEQAIPQEPQGSIFEQLISGVDVNALDQTQKQQLQFYSLISDQLESQGKTLADPEFKKIADKIKKTLQGKGGMLMEEITKGVPPPTTQPKGELEIAASPGGIGEIEGIENGKATVNVNGKKHRIDEKAFLKPPKEAAIEALELIKSFTPEQERSAHHMLNAYDEGEKKGFFVFHNGSAYVVDDITPEEYKELSEEIEAAKTTGENIIGKWSQGEGSRGAAYNKVVKGVRDRKVVPDLKKKFRKLKVGYNLLKEWQRLINEK